LGQRGHAPYPLLAGGATVLVLVGRLLMVLARRRNLIGWRGTRYPSSLSDLDWLPLP
jgi:hypothetical protein